MALEDPVIAPVQETVPETGTALDAVLDDVLDTEPAPAPVMDGLPPRFACFVTGTDTEIGKTLVSSALLHALVAQGVRACGMKPVAAGADMRDGRLHNDDCDQLEAAGNVRLPQSITTPFLLKEPAAPHIAAALEGIAIDPVPILAAFLEIAAASDATIVEGVGGFRVPLNDTYDTADLAEQLDLPVILVVGMRLGCINHALLTVEAIAARGLKLIGWVANALEDEMAFEDENIEALAARIPAPLLGCIPRLDEPGAAAAAAHLDFNSLPDWPAPRHTI